MRSENLRSRSVHSAAVAEVPAEGKVVLKPAEKKPPAKPAKTFDAEWTAGPAAPDPRPRCGRATRMNPEDCTLGLVVTAGGRWRARPPQWLLAGGAGRAGDDAERRGDAVRHRGWPGHDRHSERTLLLRGLHCFMEIRAKTLEYSAVAFQIIARINL